MAGRPKSNRARNAQEKLQNAARPISRRSAKLFGLENNRIREGDNQEPFNQEAINKEVASRGQRNANRIRRAQGQRK